MLNVIAGAVLGIIAYAVDLSTYPDFDHGSGRAIIALGLALVVGGVIEFSKRKLL
jgi:ABC-type tungstate transport system substrate-binding protein